MSFFNCIKRFSFDTLLLYFSASLLASSCVELSLNDKDKEPTFKIIFDSNGGSPVKSQEVKLNKFVKAPKPPTRAGYVFSSWYSNQKTTTRFDFEKEVISSNSTLYAKWLHIYTVSFDMGIDDPIESQKIVEGDEIFKPGNPTNPNYSFEGWFTNKSFSTAFDFKKPVISSVVIFTKWTPVFTVTFNTNGGGGGSSILPRRIKKGQLVSRPNPQPHKLGYTFRGWYSDVQLNTLYNFNNGISTSITLYAKWNNKNKYLVHFQTNGGTVIEKQVVKEGDIVLRPKTPKKTDQIFENWYSDAQLKYVFGFSTPITKETTLYARWVSETKYTVHFETNGGSALNDLKIKEGEMIPYPTIKPTKNGYKFVDWFVNNSYERLYRFSQSLLTNVTIYAKWNELFTVRFFPDNGTSIPTQEIEDQNKAKKPSTPVKKGYVLVNWYRDSKKSVIFNFNNEPILADTSIYAKWRKKTYSISFESNNGSFRDEVRVSYKDALNNPKPPSRSGFSFAGWFTDNYSFLSRYDFKTPVTSSITLYAKWVEYPKFLSFKFELANNPNTTLDTKDAVDLIGIVKYLEKSVTLEVGAYVDIEKLHKASFTLPRGTSVKIGNTIQTSGVSTANFTSAVVYTLTNGFKVTQHTVTITRNALAEIPDDNFRNFLKTIVPNSFISGNKIDTAHSSIQTITQINCDGLQIRSVKGIQFFKNLVSFSCKRNKISRLNLSENKKLNTLHSTENPISSMDISTATSLTTLTLNPCTQSVTTITFSVPTNTFAENMLSDIARVCGTNNVRVKTNTCSQYRIGVGCQDASTP